MNHRTNRRRRIRILCLLTALLLLLPACGARETPTEDPGDVPGTADPAGSPAENEDAAVPYAAQGVVFQVPEDWLRAEGTDMFYTDQNEACGLNGASPLGSYEPQAFYEELADYYRGQFDSFSAPETLTDWQSADGTACLTADLTGVYESVLYCTRIIIAPQKNLVLTFAAQADKDLRDPALLRLKLNRLCESLTFEIGARDEISGNTFLCGDGSLLCLREDGGFQWRQSAEDPGSPYYEGVYEVFRGRAAMDKTASMTEYGLTVEELERVLSASMNGYVPGESRPADLLYAMGELEDTRERYQVCLDTFYAVILHNRRLVTSPEEVQEGGNDTLYIGFYLPELQMADLTNCSAGSNTQWTFRERTA